MKNLESSPLPAVHDGQIVCWMHTAKYTGSHSKGGMGVVERQTKAQVVVKLMNGNTSKYWKATRKSVGGTGDQFLVTEHELNAIESAKQPKRNAGTPGEQVSAYSNCKPAKRIDGNAHLMRLLHKAGICSGECELGGEGHGGTVVSFVGAVAAKLFVRWMRDNGYDALVSCAKLLPATSARDACWSVSVLWEKPAHVTLWPNLARFLADHFGGYESAQAAADAEHNGDLKAYMDEFLDWLAPDGTDGLSGAQLADLQSAELFLADNSDFDALRNVWFDDAGNPRDDVPPPVQHEPGYRMVCAIVKFWN